MPKDLEVQFVSIKLKNNERQKEMDQNRNEKIQCRLQIVSIWNWHLRTKKLWYENLLPCNLMKSSESALTWNPMQSQWCASEAFFLFQYSRKVTAGAGGRLFWLGISVFSFMMHVYNKLNIQRFQKLSKHYSVNRLWVFRKCEEQENKSWIIIFFQDRFELD